jgi:hypothetical protein
MKKLFLFATVAAAGLFASCSSSDDAIADAGTAIENVDGDKQAIKVGIGNMVDTATRGTGTVGGVGDGSSVANVWAGQRINVFMFKQITATNQTLTLATEKDANNDDVSIYENTVMITPGSPENLITSPNNESTDDDGSGEAMIEDGSIKYYPSTGNYDFFGYHADDAVTGAVASEGAAATLKKYVPFKIDGSQDLMSTKAALLVEYNTPGDPTSGLDPNCQKYKMDNATGHETDYYSAYSARKKVQPALTFDHLLTRLAFKIKPGNKEAAGFGQDYIINSVNNPTIDADTYNSLSATDKALFEEVPASNPVTYKFVDAPTTDSYKNYSAAVQALLTVTTSDGQDASRAVMVKEIKVKSKNTGKLYVAWTALDNSMDLHAKIDWNAATEWLSLQERPHAKLKAGMTITAGTDYDLADEPAVVTAWKAAIAALDTQSATYDDEKDALEAKIAKFWSSVSEDVYNILSNNASVGKEKYDVLTNTNRANADLVALNPVAAQAKDGTTYANYGTTEAYGAKEVSVGEALLVAPNAWDATANNNAGAYTGEPLEMEVTVSQRVPTDWNYPTKLENVEMKYTLPVPPTAYDANKAGSGAFMANYSYNVILTVYGYNRIEVHTVVSAWNAGGNRNVGGDDDPAAEWEEWTETNNQNP